jgi:hypothetical protein
VTVRLRLSGPVALACVLVAFAIIYGGDVGRGFIKDDFSWILNSPLDSFADLRRAFTATPMGFYRPLVTISFGLNERLFGLAPAGYAWTNLVLAALITVLIAALVVSMGFSGPAGAFAAGLWAFNVHGLNMALLWTSGRTSLIGTLGAVAAALAFTRRRFTLAGVCTLGALLGKEEPLLLPIVFAIWAMIDERAAGGGWSAAPRVAVRQTWPSVLALMVYLTLRVQTAAFTPGTAPAVYQLHPSAMLDNVLPYLDRSLTFTGGVLLFGWIVFSRRELTIDGEERRTLAKGLAWLVLGFALTIMVVSRSSLYVVLPSVGSALMGLAVGRAIWRSIPARRATRATGAALIVPLALWPVYHARNARLKNEAILSSAVLATIRAAVNERPDIVRIVVRDDPAARPSATSALGEQLGDAVRLVTARPIACTIVPAGSSEDKSAADPTTLALSVSDGAISAR